MRKILSGADDNKKREIFKKYFDKFSVDDLKIIAGVVNELINFKAPPEVVPEVIQPVEIPKEVEVKYYVYTHVCKNRSSSHLRKYKHWLKLVTGVDLSKTTGYAFLGDFLSVEREHKLSGENITVEVCNEDIDAYFIDETGYYMQIGNRENTKSMSRLIDLVNEALKKPEIYREKIRIEKEENKKTYDARQEAWKRFFALINFEYDMNKRTKEFYLANRTEQNKQAEIDTYFKIV